jgi:hypothetical protein
MMATRLVLAPYIENWDGQSLRLRLLLVPRGNPLDPLIDGAPNFPSAKFVLEVHLTQELDALPAPGNPAFSTFTSPSVPTALPLFQAAEQTFQIDPAPRPQPPRPAGTQVKKHLPLTYQTAVGFAPGRSSLVFTDDTYSCAIKTPPPRPFHKLPPPSPLISWAKVIAIFLRNSKLAEATGLAREFTIPIEPPALLSKGGWIFLTLAPGSDGAGLFGVPDGLKIFSSRIPPLTKARDLFSPVLFPVTATPPAADYGDLFAEAEGYSDGQAKAVHCTQPQQLDPLLETPDGTRPTKELGIRIGWDDEQVAIWMNRQIDPTQAVLNASVGVHGYRIDARLVGDTVWHSLTRAAGPLRLGNVDLGNFDGELSVQTHPVQLHAQHGGDFWLPTYFTAWVGPALGSLDIDQIRLAGGPDNTALAKVKGVPPDIALRYGNRYKFRVRLMDHTGGGPGPQAGAPQVPGPAPVGAIDFRRWIRPLAPKLVDPPPSPLDPSNPPTQLIFRRPLLFYPAVVCTGGYPDPIPSLLNDLPKAQAEKREVGLPDPDVDRLQIVVEAQDLAQDPAASDGGFVPLFHTVRSFPVDPAAELRLDLEWMDSKDAAAITSPPTGPIPLPRARNLRLRVSALCREDSTLAYFGAQDVRSGSAISISLRADAQAEQALFAPDLPTHRFSAYFLQPDPPVDATVLFAQRASGNLNQRPTDIITRLASALGLRNEGLALRAKAGRRIVFGCASSIRNTIGPDLASVLFASQTDLAKHWLLVLRLTLDRDWTWDGLEQDGIVVVREGIEVGRFGPNRSVNNDALQLPDRSQTDLLFIDALDPKPAPGIFPQELHLVYTVTANLIGKPLADPPLQLEIQLPVTTPPSQHPEIVSAGIAMSPYQRDTGYTSSEPRRRVLWLEFSSPPQDPQDGYFARVLRNAPDPLLLDQGSAVIGGPHSGPVLLPETAEPPLAIDPELVRKIVPNESDDRAGLDAMQPLIASDSPVHYLLPLPAGMTDSSPELFGFFTYEIRVGHATRWSTAQGRYGPPLRVGGIQLPAPMLSCTVWRDNEGIRVSAPFAMPVFDGRPLQPIFPNTAMWVLLYAQAQQVDGTGRRNVLLSRQQALVQRSTVPAPRTDAFGEAFFPATGVQVLLQAMAFEQSAPLSVMAVELFPQDIEPQDPLGADLGSQRILRTSPLTAVPVIC